MPTITLPTSGQTAWATTLNTAINTINGAVDGNITAISGKYTKPAPGIPYGDLEASVQLAIDKANSALQNVTITVTDVLGTTALGRTLMTITDAPAARTAIGAGTSSLVIGTTAGTAADAAATTTAIAAKADSSAMTAALALKADASALTTKANIASPTFTGTVTIPTPTAGDNSTKAASTAFVAAAVAGVTPITLGCAIVAYNATSNTWFPRPSGVTIVIFVSTNSATAARPADMVVGDVWIQSPDAVLS